MIESVIKRDGSVQDFSPAKLNGWGEWASSNLGGDVDWSYVVAHTVSVLPKKCPSKLLQEQLIKTCLEQDTWSYNRMAGRLIAALTYKDLYGDSIPSIKEVHAGLVKDGLMVELKYSAEDYAKLEGVIDHKIDLTYAHYQIDHIRKKYALKNRTNKKEYESPQFVMMRMAMALAEDEPSDTRIGEVKEWYQQFATNAINCPTPNYVNLGTPLKGYASCAVYTASDDARSLAVGDHIAYTMTCMSAGIGSHINTRAMGDPVRGGVIQHQGKLPYYRSLVAGTHANLQAGRGGASTIHYPLFDPEVETIARLKNPMSTEDKKIRGADYSMQSNKFIARKVAKNEEMFMFTSFTAPDLYEAFYSGDEVLFEKLYDKYLNNKSFKKQWFKPRDVVLTVLNEGYETGRAYLHFPDEANRHTPFKETIYSSNLC